jgi:hypothetical protein
MYAAFAEERENAVDAKTHTPWAIRWEDARRADNGQQLRRVIESALKRGPFVDFAGYHQRHFRTA